MFDDPKKELKRLEEQLLAAEMSDEEFERFYDEIYEEFGPKEPRQDTNLVSDVPIRNYSNGYGRKPQAAPAAGRSTNAAAPARGAAPARNAYTDSSRSAAPVKKEKGIRGLVIAVCLESLGIVAVVLWWVLRIL